uniref:Zinc metalloproteinase n=1 Tax=Strongyloides papillosus TaxID=174720 RepID=A0A0N5BN26_STREA
MNSFTRLLLFFQCILEVILKNESILIADGNSESSETRIKKSILKDIKFKWTLPIDYRIRNGVDRKTVKAALAVIEKETCIRFRETIHFKNGGLNYVNKSKGCSSFTGKVSNNRPQDINLGSSCNKLTIAIHETCHALGMIHEMSRHDRDSYIKLKFENIDGDAIFNFMLFDLSVAIPYGLKYDFGSVMHYDRLAGSVNERITMEPKYQNYLTTIGQTTRFGFNDAKQLNIHYCKDKCRGSKLNCKMGGYPHPNDCRFCKCPAFFTGKLCTKLLPSDKKCGKTSPAFYTGKLCTKLLPSDKKCGKTRFKSKYTNKLLIVKGIKTCYIKITAPRGRKVQLNILETNFRNSFVCQPNKGLEVKFLADKAVSGAMFCGRNFGKVLTSQNNVVVMKYVGLIPYSVIKIRYRNVT